jgi:hypothetical protein
MSRTLWRFLDRNSLPSEHIEAKVMEFLRKGVLSKRQTINGQGQELVTTEINMEHPLVIKALPVIVDDLLDAVESGDDDDVVVPADVPEIGDGVAMRGASGGAETWEPASETSRYQRRFSSGSGAWRGRSNVRNGSRPDER